MQNKAAAIYVRRTGEESDTSDRQVAILHAIAEQEGYAVKSIWIDTAPLDARRRPALDALRRMVASAEIAVVMIPSLATLGMTVLEMVAFVGQLHEANIRLIADDIDTGTPDGTGWVAGILSLNKTYEALRREKVRLGQQRARQAGIRCGRPPASASKLAKVRVALAAGGGIRSTARQCGVSPATVWRVRNAMRPRTEHEAGTG